jgi:hypothetical protein
VSEICGDDGLIRLGSENIIIENEIIELKAKIKE